MFWEFNSVQEKLWFDEIILDTCLYLGRRYTIRSRFKADICYI